MPIVDGLSARVIDDAAHRLAEGALVAFATETVYGLGARADRDDAVARIFASKQRPPDHPLIVHVADAAGASAFAADLTPSARLLMTSAWPGPVSLVLPRRPGVAEVAAAGLPTVALRCPSHPVAQALLLRARALGVPGVAAPSANRFGRVSPTRATHVADEFGPDLWVLDGGPCQAGIESAIVDCTGERPRLLRPGSVPRDQLEAWLGQALHTRTTASPRVSGSLDSHYAPGAAVEIVEPSSLGARVAALQSRLGPAAVAAWSRVRPARLPASAHRVMPDNARDAAHHLFDHLRQLDASGAQVICVERPPQDPDWEGVRDRLARAAAPRS